MSTCSPPEQSVVRETVSGARIVQFCLPIKLNMHMYNTKYPVHGKFQPQLNMPKTLCEN